MGMGVVPLVPGVAGDAALVEAWDACLIATVGCPLYALMTSRRSSEFLGWESLTAGGAVEGENELVSHFSTSSELNSLSGLPESFRFFFLFHGNFDRLDFVVTAGASCVADVLGRLSGWGLLRGGGGEATRLIGGALG